jgi:hypothetical protein
VLALFSLTLVEIDNTQQLVNFVWSKLPPPPPLRFQNTALSKLRSVVEILTTMDDEPHVSLYPWELDIRNTAASLCKAITPRGLLSLVLTDAQWDAYAANISVDANGQAVIAARYASPVHVEVNDTMNQIALYVAKSSNDQLLEWINGKEALKSAIVKSLGKVVRHVTRSAIDGFTLMSLRQIMDKVRARYGRMAQDTRAQLDEKMTTRLQSTETFDSHISNPTENYAISEIGGYPISQDKQVKIFRTSVYDNPLIANALESFDSRFPDARLHTFATITEYVVDHLSNLQNASKKSARATANIMTYEACLTLEVENKKLKAATQASTNQEAQRWQRKRQGQAQQKQKEQNQWGKDLG